MSAIKMYLSRQQQSRRRLGRSSSSTVSLVTLLCMMLLQCAYTAAADANKGAYPIKATCKLAPKNAEPRRSFSKDATISPRAFLRGKAESCTGTITLTQTSAGETTISWDIKNCGAGLHGLHIHEKADFSDGCTSAGGHYNPLDQTHGGPGDQIRHVGDLGNIKVDADGNSKGSRKDPLIKLEGEYSVLGRAMMIHADADDLGTGDSSETGVNGKTSETTGNAGGRIACGEIVA